jgi:hypothetical protein
MAMVAVLDVDDLGMWVAIKCDGWQCYRHVSGRPVAGREWSAGELLDAVMGWAMEDGWQLVGRALCPQHKLVGAMDGRVGEGYQWTRVKGPGSERR